MAPSNGTKSAHSPKVGRHPPPQTILIMAPCNGLRQSSWSPHSTPMAPSNGTTPTTQVGRHPPAHYNGTLQWQHVLLQSWSSPSPLPPPQTIVLLQSWSSLQHYNGTLPWHPAMAPRPLPQSWSSPSPPTIAHYSGTLVPRPIRQSGSSPSPLLEVRTPIAIAIWGIIYIYLQYLYRYINVQVTSISNVKHFEMVISCNTSILATTYELARVNVNQSYEGFWTTWLGTK